MENRRAIASIVLDTVNREQDHGLLARIWRQSRRPGIVSTSVGSGNRTALLLLSASGSDGEDFHPLGMDLAGECDSFSLFRLSSVSECLLTSYLADVKVLLLSSCAAGWGSAG